MRGLLLNQFVFVLGPATGFDARSTQVSEYCGKPLEESARESGARGCPVSCLANGRLLNLLMNLGVFL